MPRWATAAARSASPAKCSAMSAHASSNALPMIFSASGPYVQPATIAVLIVATEVCHESESIKGMALQIMALSYRGSWLDPGGKIPDGEASLTAALAR
jgi:hypothetical protein